MRVARTVGSLILSIAAITAATTASAAASATQPDGVWHRYHQADFTVDPGAACSFGVNVKVLYDREYYRNLSKYPNGKPHLQLWRGPLILQYTNADSGRSVIRNASGVAYESYNSDGSFHAIRIISGHFSAALKPGSDPGPGMYYVGGHGSRLSIADDGTEVLTLGKNGSAEDLCSSLGR